MRPRETDVQQEWLLARGCLLHRCYRRIGEPAFLRFVKCQRARASFDALPVAFAELRQQVVILQLLHTALAQEARISRRAPDNTARTLGIALVKNIALVFHPVLRTVDLSHGRAEITSRA